MTDVPSSVLKIDLSDGSSLRFAKPEDIRAWLDKQVDEFRWLQEGGSRAGRGVQNLASHYVNGFNNIRQALNSFLANQENEGLKQRLTSGIQSFYSTNTVVESDHEFARIAKEIRVKDGSTAASAAFGFLLGSDCDITFETLKGIISAKLKQDGIDPQSPNIVAKAIADLNSNALTDRLSSTRDWDQIASGARSFLESTDSAFKKQTEDLRSSTKETFDRVNQAVNGSIESIRLTEATYKEQMKLQAPVEYWLAKATKHETALRASRRNVVLLATVGSGLLLIALFAIANTALGLAETSNADTAIFLKFAAISAVATTIGFWIGRVLLRIYLSDRHLLTDAEERIALIKTYLALSSDGKVDSADRALILAPLFRSAADGIVKDEGPDASVAGIIAKAFDLKSR